MFESQAASIKLALIIDRDAALFRTVRADPGKVRQVVINLVGNALKFTDQGRVVVHASSMNLSAGASGADDCVIQIAVEDTGAGIAAEDQERIFEAFRQAANGAHRGGTGLG